MHASCLSHSLHRSSWQRLPLLLLLCPSVDLTCTSGATQQALWSCIVLNSITLSAACSTYFQLCGNGAAGPGSSSSQGSGLSAVLHDAVCVKYLAPIATQEYPKFSAWMLYGESNSSSAHVAAAAAARQNRCSSTGRSWLGFGGSSNCEPYVPVVNSSSSLVEFVKSVPVGDLDAGGSVISPVFTVWITLVTLYIGESTCQHHQKSVRCYQQESLSALC